MPKPSEIPLWNTDESNRITPPVGVQATGHEANSTPSSSYENWRAGLAGDWCQWVSDGTSSPDATAHIVETDGDGQIESRGLTIDVSAFPPGAPLTVTNSIGGAAEFSSGGADAAVVINGGSGAPALVVTAGENSPGILVRGDGTGAAIDVEASAGAPGIVARGNTGNAALEVRSSDSAGAHGLVTVTDDGTPSAVFGHYAQCEVPGGTAIYAEAASDGTEAGAAISAVGGSGVDSEAVALRGTVVGDGYVCELLPPPNPTRAPLRLRPCTADPSTRQDGDVWSREMDGDDEGGLYIQERGFSRAVHATLGGHAGFFAESRSTSSTLSTTQQAKITANFGVYAPKRAGVVRLRVCAEMEKTQSSSGVIQIFDATAGSVVASRTIEFVADTPRDIVLETTYTLPAAGARTFRLTYASAVVASGSVRIREASLRCDGVY